MESEDQLREEEEVECQSSRCYCPGKVKISTKRGEVRVFWSGLYLYGGRRVHWDCGETSVLGGVDHSVVSQQVEVRLGLLQLHLGDGGGVLGDWTIVGVRVEDPVAVGRGRTGVGHADGSRGRGRGAGLVLVLAARDGDGQRSHLTSAGPVTAGGLLPRRRHQGGRRRELVVIVLRNQGLEIDPDVGAGEPQRTTAKN